jgi:hypothetical protein
MGFVIRKDIRFFGKSQREDSESCPLTTRTIFSRNDADSTSFFKLAHYLSLQAGHAKGKEY